MPRSRIVSASSGKVGKGGVEGGGGSGGLGGRGGSASQNEFVGRVWSQNSLPPSANLTPSSKKSLNLFIPFKIHIQIFKSQIDCGL